MTGAGRVLLDAALRTARQAGSGGGASVLILRLSALRPPAPRPHHRRVARALLNSAAERQDGLVIALDDPDLALVCPAAAAEQASDLPAVLARLLRADTDDPRHLIRHWHVPDAHAALEAELSGYAAPPRAPVAVIAAPFLPRAGAAPDLLGRQTAVLLNPAGTLPAVQPMFHELCLRSDLLASLEPGWAEARDDPFLARALSPAAEARVLGMLDRARGAAGALDVARAGALPVHLNLTPSAIASDAFGRLMARHAEAPGAPALGIEVALLEALGDPACFAAARSRVIEAGQAFVLDDVPLEALLMADLAVLAPGLVKLRWTARFAKLPEEQAACVDAALVRLGPQRVLLCDADTEAAVRWGVARRVRRFQGAYADALLAAARLASCAQAAQCTLRQCMERATATSPAGRALCRNTALLDAAA